MGLILDILLETGLSEQSACNIIAQCGSYSLYYSYYGALRAKKKITTCTTQGEPVVTFTPKGSAILCKKPHKGVRKFF